jgi:hypothetical protein
MLRFAALIVGSFYHTHLISVMSLQSTRLSHGW